MRTLRLSLMGTVILALLGGLSGAVVAQEDVPMVESPSGFSGALGCPSDHQVTDYEDAMVGALDESELIQHSSRARFKMPIEAMTDPRLDGTLTNYWNANRYVTSDMDPEPVATLITVTIRIENEVGAWQGSRPDAWVAGGPVPDLWFVPLVGEGAYEGLVAAWWQDQGDPECSCADDEACTSRVFSEVFGVVFHGEMPPAYDITD